MRQSSKPLLRIQRGQRGVQRVGEKIMIEKSHWHCMRLLLALVSLVTAAALAIAIVGLFYPVSFSTVSTRSIQQTSLVIGQNGSLPDNIDHVLLDNEEPITLTLACPAASSYIDREISIYSLTNVSHSFVLGPSCIGFDKYNRRTIRFEPQEGAGFKFRVLSPNLFTILGFTCIEWCDGTGCTRIDEAPTSIVVEPVEPNEGAFAFPDDASTFLPIFPTIVSGMMTFPPTDSREYSSIQGALDDLKGKVVHNTTIFLPPGTYRENLLFDGFTSGNQPSGTEDELQLAGPNIRGLTLVGDSRVIMGNTWINCQDAKRINYEFLGGSQGMGLSVGLEEGNDNNITVVGGDTLVVFRLANDGGTSSTQTDFIRGGVEAGDLLLIKDFTGTFYEVAVAAVPTATSIQLDLSSSDPAGIDLDSIFSQCGSAFTFLPNRVVEGIPLDSVLLAFGAGVSNAETTNSILFTLFRQSPFANVIINQDVSIFGIRFKTVPAPFALPQLFNVSQSHARIAAGARLFNTVWDSRGTNFRCDFITATESAEFTQCGCLTVHTGDGYISTIINDGSFIGNVTEGTNVFDTAGAGGIPLKNGFALTIVGGKARSTLGFYGGSRASEIQLLVMLGEQEDIGSTISEGILGTFQTSHVYIKELMGEWRILTQINADMTIINAQNLYSSSSPQFTVGVLGGGQIHVDKLVTENTISSPILNIGDNGQFFANELLWRGFSRLTDVVSVANKIVIRRLSPFQGTAFPETLFPNGIVPDLQAVESSQLYVGGARVWAMGSTSTGSSGGGGPTGILSPSSTRLQISANTVAVPGIITRTFNCDFDGSPRLFLGNVYRVYSELAFAHQLVIPAQCGFTWPGGFYTATFTSAAIGDGLTFYVTTPEIIVEHTVGMITFS